MFIVKEMENSDVRCGCVTKSFVDEKSAREFMKFQFERTKEILGGIYADHEREDIDAEKQQWATINSTAAHIQVGFDAYDWEIEEDPEWVKKDSAPKGYIVVGYMTDLESGELKIEPPVYTKTKEDARQVMGEMYQATLKTLDVPDNNACDTEGNSCPGGWIGEDSANIWDYAEYAAGCLVNVATFAYYPLTMAAKELK